MRDNLVGDNEVVSHLFRDGGSKVFFKNRCDASPWPWQKAVTSSRSSPWRLCCSAPSAWLPLCVMSATPSAKLRLCNCQSSIFIPMSHTTGQCFGGLSTLTWRDEAFPGLGRARCIIRKNLAKSSPKCPRISLLPLPTVLRRLSIKTYWTDDHKRSFATSTFSEAQNVGHIYNTNRPNITHAH